MKFIAFSINKLLQVISITGIKNFQIIILNVILKYFNMLFVINR